MLVDPSIPLASLVWRAAVIDFYSVALESVVLATKFPSPAVSSESGA